METRPELSHYIELLLEDESWQTGEGTERRIQREFAISMLTYADREDLDLQTMYKRVLAGLKAMR